MSQVIILVSLLAFASCCQKEEINPTECEQNCALEPHVGFGNAAIPKYYFDPVEKNASNLSGVVWEA